MLGLAGFQIAFSDLITSTINNYLLIIHDLFIQKQKQMNETFLETLSIIPSGVILINNNLKQEISFSN